MNIDKQIKEFVEEVALEKFKSATETIIKKNDSMIDALLEAKLKNLRPIVVDLKKAKKIVGAQIRHERTEEVLQYVAAKVPLLLVGPAGSGKTHIATDCATALGIPHYSISVNEQTSKADFLGYVDANGNIVKTNFRKAYEEGGVFIIDEIDAGNPNILTVINSALANNFCPFPDKMVERHSDFVCVCTANTFGDGESVEYIGRNILDAATRDRFACLTINYSDAVENVLVPNFKRMIDSLRKLFKDQGTNIVLSTRGGMRLEQIFAIKNKTISIDEIIDCLNLHQEAKKNVKITQIISEHLVQVLS